MPDIDIDLKNREDILEKLPHIPASIIRDGEIKKHNTGVFFHQMPVDPLTGLASVDYKEAEERGLFKIDLLNLSLYDKVRDEDHLITLINKEPLWEMFDDKDIVGQLFHLHGHFDIVEKMKPRTLEELAMVLAIIRPAKRYLLGKSWDEVRKEIWEKPEDGSYAFKKSHSFGYSLAIIVQMNLLLEEVLG